MRVFKERMTRTWRGIWQTPLILQRGAPAAGANARDASGVDQHYHLTAGSLLNQLLKPRCRLFGQLHESRCRLFTRDSWGGGQRFGGRCGGWWRGWWGWRSHLSLVYSHNYDGSLCAYLKRRSCGQPDGPPCNPTLTRYAKLHQYISSEFIHCWFDGVTCLHANCTSRGQQYAGAMGAWPRNV